MRAIHIDSDNCKIVDVELPDQGSQLSELHRLVGGYIEIAHRFQNGVIVGPEIYDPSAEDGRPSPAQTRIEDLNISISWSANG